MSRTRSLCFHDRSNLKAHFFFGRRRSLKAETSCSCDRAFVICIHSFIPLFIYFLLLFFSNCPQAVAREKLDKIREENQSKTRKDYEMTISELKVGSVSRSDYFGFRH